MLAYDPSVLEFVSGTNANGGAGSIRLIGTMDSDNTTSFSYTLTFKTLQAGNTGTVSYTHLRGVCSWYCRRRPVW